MMNKRRARQIAKEKYGPGANVVNVCSVNRHERFGIVIYSPGGTSGQPVLGCLGHGDSYQTAWKHAEESSVAQAMATEWLKTKADFQMFKNNPVGYKKLKIDEMQNLLDKGQNNGR